MSKDILKDSKKFRDGLVKRWKEVKISQQGVADDAVNRGQTGITRSAINKYIHNPYAKGALNQEFLCWLGWRWLVPVTLQIGIPKINTEYVIPDKYDEDKALELLNKVFPKKRASKK